MQKLEQGERTLPLLGHATAAVENFAPSFSALWMMDSTKMVMAFTFGEGMATKISTVWANKQAAAGSSRFRCLSAKWIL